MDTEGFDEIFRKAEWPEKPFDAHVFVTDVHRVDERVMLMLELISLDERSVSPALFWGNQNQVRAVFDTAEAEQLEGQWRALQLVRGSRNGPSLSILASFADPEGTTYSIQSVSAPSPMVTLAHSRPAGRAATPQDISNFLRRASQPGLTRLGVLDVGQGAAAFLYSSPCVQPSLYLDIGGGCGFNAHTFPAGGVQWCFTRSPGILLSHWHWDHWAGATYGGVANIAGARAATWLVPSTPPGPLAKKLVSDIMAAGGTVMHWPVGHPPVAAGNLLVGEATGKGWNNSGLALLAELEPKRFTLVPGDAAYICLPSALKRSTLKTLLVPHHGGNLEANPPVGLPVPDGKPNCHAYCSVGDQNTYGHPTISSNYLAAGWHLVRTDVRPVGTVSKHYDAETGGMAGGLVPPYCNGGLCSLALST